MFCISHTVLHTTLRADIFFFQYFFWDQNARTICKTYQELYNSAACEVPHFIFDLLGNALLSSQTWNSAKNKEWTTHFLTLGSLCLP